MGNAQVQRWFNDGLIEEALLGDGKFRISDVTFREKHDRLLVLGDLYEWANDNKIPDLEKKLKDILKKILEFRFEDAIDILLCYFLVRPYVPNIINIDPVWLETEVLGALKIHGANVCSNEELRGQIEALSEFLPKII